MCSQRQLTDDEVLYYAEQMHDTEELIALLGVSVHDIVEAFEERVLEHRDKIENTIRTMEG